MVYEDLEVGMPLTFAVGTDCLPCEVRGEAEERVGDVNVAPKLDSLLVLRCQEDSLPL